MMQWEKISDVTIDEDAYYIVLANGEVWRDFDLMIMHGILVKMLSEPKYIRNRPEWIAKIVRPLNVI